MAREYLELAEDWQRRRPAFAAASVAGPAVAVASVVVVFDCSCNRTGAWAEERIVERTVAAMAVDRSFVVVDRAAAVACSCDM